MNPVTHFLTGWLVANVDGLERRDRAIVTFASVIPDADGLGILTGIASQVLVAARRSQKRQCCPPFFAGWAELSPAAGFSESGLTHYP